MPQSPDRHAALIAAPGSDPATATWYGRDAAWRVAADAADAPTTTTTTREAPAASKLGEDPRRSQPQ